MITGNPRHGAGVIKFFYDYICSNAHIRIIFEEEEMSTTRIGFIGSGRVTAFMIEGLRRGRRDLSFSVMDANPAVSESLARGVPVETDTGDS